MRVMITCGGTGGHINPAIAIANTIKERIPDAEILFVGTKRGKESELVPKAGYELKFVESEGIKRSLSPSNIRAVIRALISPYLAKPIIREFAPDVVVGTGGYACWPVLKGASLLGIPCAVHESNAIPGMAVKRLQKSVDKILVNFEETANYMAKKNKIVRVGNPLVSGFSNMEKDAARERCGIPKDALCVLSYGGSGGAEFLNLIAVDVMKEYIASRRDIVFVHAAGSRDYAATKARFDELGLDHCPNIRLQEYIYDMPSYMAAADVVICRAGAMTISELSMMEKASIIIPSPNVVDDHQYKNAKVLADAGAACLLREEGLDAASLWKVLESLLYDEKKRMAQQAAVCHFADREANQRIFEELMALAGKRNGKQK